MGKLCSILGFYNPSRQSRVWIWNQATFLQLELDYNGRMWVTYRSQSTVMMSVTSSGGSPTVSRTMTIVTRPAWGMPAAPILAAVAVTLNNKNVFTIYKINVEPKWRFSGFLHFIIMFWRTVLTPFSGIRTRYAWELKHLQSSQISEQTPYITLLKTPKTSFQKNQNFHRANLKTCINFLFYI